MASEERRIIDVNVLAIFLVKDHPGHDCVVEVIEDGLRGAYVPLIMDVLPIRVYWIMIRRWSCDPKESREAIGHFIRVYDSPVYFQLTKETILTSSQIAEEAKHDVFDCAYIAAALQEKATGIVTTDADFAKLGRRYNLDYWNPVPEEMLRRFKEWGTE